MATPSFQCKVHAARLPGSAKPDPFVVVQYGNPLRDVHRTKKLGRTSNPVWNEEFLISIPGDDLVLSIYDYDILSKNEQLCTATIPKTRLFSCDEKFPLIMKKGEKAVGEIHFSSFLQDAYGGSRVYGLSLQALLQQELGGEYNISQSPNLLVPSILFETIRFLFHKGLGTVKLGHEIGNMAAVTELRWRWNQGHDITLQSNIDPNCVMSLLRGWLRFLPSPILDTPANRLYERWIDFLSFDFSSSKAVDECLHLLKCLPVPNRVVVASIVYIGKLLLENAQVNQLTPVEISRIFAHNLLWRNPASLGRNEDGNLLCTDRRLTDLYVFFLNKFEKLFPRQHIRFPAVFYWGDPLNKEETFSCVELYRKLVSSTPTISSEAITEGRFTSVRLRPLFCLREIPKSVSLKGKSGGKENMVWCGGDGFVASWSTQQSSLLSLDCMRTLQAYVPNNQVHSILVIEEHDLLLVGLTKFLLVMNSQTHDIIREIPGFFPFLELLNGQLFAGGKDYLTFFSIPTFQKKELGHFLHQGSEDGEANAIENAYAKLVRLLLHSSLALMCAVVDFADPSSAASIAPNFFNVFLHNNSDMFVLYTLIQKEIRENQHPSTWFRSNNLTTHLLTQACKHYGSAYLKKTLAPLITHVSKLDSSGFDIKVQDPKELQENQSRVIKYTKMFFFRLQESHANVPQMFKHVAQILQSAVKHDHPELRHSVVGSFLFLRFICPGMVSPYDSDVISTPLSADSRRILILISKILQIISNGTKSKEPSMAFANPFIEQSTAPFQDFVDQIAGWKNPSIPPPPAPLLMEPTLPMTHVRKVHQFLQNEMVNLREWWDEECLTDKARRERTSDDLKLSKSDMSTDTVLAHLEYLLEHALPDPFDEEGAQATVPQCSVLWMLAVPSSQLWLSSSHALMVIDSQHFSRLKLWKFDSAQDCGMAMCLVGRTVWVATQSSMIVVYDSETLEKIEVINAVNVRPERLCCLNQKIVLSYGRPQIGIWDAEKRVWLGSTDGSHSSSISEVLPLQKDDGTYDIWTASRDGTLGIWNLNPVQILLKGGRSFEEKEEEEKQKEQPTNWQWTFGIPFELLETTSTNEDKLPDFFYGAIKYLFLHGLNCLSLTDIPMPDQTLLLKTDVSLGAVEFDEGDSPEYVAYLLRVFFLYLPETVFDTSWLEYIQYGVPEEKILEQIKSMTDKSSRVVLCILLYLVELQRHLANNQIINQVKPAVLAQTFLEVLFPTNQGESCTCKWDYMVHILHTHRNIIFKSINLAYPWRFTVSSKSPYKVKWTLARKQFLSPSSERMSPALAVFKGEEYVCVGTTFSLALFSKSGALEKKIAPSGSPVGRTVSKVFPSSNPTKVFLCGNTAATFWDFQNNKVETVLPGRHSQFLVLNQSEGIVGCLCNDFFRVYAITPNGVMSKNFSSIDSTLKDVLCEEEGEQEVEALPVVPSATPVAGLKKLITEHGGPTFHALSYVLQGTAQKHISLLYRMVQMLCFEGPILGDLIQFELKKFDKRKKGEKGEKLEKKGSLDAHLLLDPSFSDFTARLLAHALFQGSKSYLIYTLLPSLSGLPLFHEASFSEDKDPDFHTISQNTTSVLNTILRTFNRLPNSAQSIIIAISENSPYSSMRETLIGQIFFTSFIIPTLTEDLVDGFELPKPSSDKLFAGVLKFLQLIIGGGSTRHLPQPQSSFVQSSIKQFSAHINSFLEGISDADSSPAISRVNRAGSLTKEDVSKGLKGVRMNMNWRQGGSSNLRTIPVKKKDIEEPVLEIEEPQPEGNLDQVALEVVDLLTSQLPAILAFWKVEGEAEASRIIKSLCENESSSCLSPIPTAPTRSGSCTALTFVEKYEQVWIAARGEIFILDLDGKLLKCLESSPKKEVISLACTERSVLALGPSQLSSYACENRRLITTHTLDEFYSDMEIYGAYLFVFGSFTDVKMFCAQTLSPIGVFSGFCSREVGALYATDGLNPNSIQLWTCSSDGSVSVWEGKVRRKVKTSKYLSALSEDDHTRRKQKRSISPFTAVSSPPKQGGLFPESPTLKAKGEGGFLRVRSVEKEEETTETPAQLPQTPEPEKRKRREKSSSKKREPKLKKDKSFTDVPPPISIIIDETRLSFDSQLPPPAPPPLED